MVLTLKNGLRAVITMDKDNVAAYWGDLKPVNEIDISKYKDIKEEDDMSSLSYGNLNDLFPDNIEIDPLAVDTTAVDTVSDYY